MKSEIWRTICVMVMIHEDELAEAISRFHKEEIDFSNPTLRFYFADMLKWLSGALYKKYNARVIILIDDYDMPLNQALKPIKMLRLT